jgi:hypothetical protein
MDILAVRDLTTLDPALVALVQAQAVQRMAEAYPELERKRGVIQDIVLGLMSVLSAEQRTRIDLVRLSSSLLEVAANPELADDDIVDRILANFRLERGTGAAAAGSVTVVIDALAPVVLAAGATFSAPGVQVTTVRAYAARISQAAVVGDTDRVLRPVGDGTYAFTVPMQAVAAGVAGMLRRATQLTPVDTIPRFVRAYVDGDFTGGFDAETNADMLRRLQEGMAVRAWSNRVGVDAALRAMPAFARILQTSVVGAGDPEMLRDKHGLLPVAMFGRVDLYVRTQALPASTTLIRTATLVDRTAAGGVWQLSLTSADAPGFHAVERVGPPAGATDDSGYEIVLDERSLDLDFPGLVPDIAGPVEGIYSRYQTATIRFLDTETPVGNLTVDQATAQYAVSVSGLPLIGELQDAVSARSFAAPAGDVLVKAPVPCTLVVSFEVRKRASSPAPDADAIRNDVAALVNATGFPGQLYASNLAGVIYGHLPDGAYVGAIDLFGTIRRPDGSLRRIRSTEVLEVPDEPERMVSKRTVTFFLDPRDVGISIVDVDMPDV